MGGLRIGLLALALALTGEVARAAPRQGVVVNPDWAEKPSPEVLSEAFPKLAMMLRIEGRVALSCDVTRKGTLEHCVAVYESPPGLGFGEAGITAAKSFKMTPKMVDGKPVEGGTVRIPLAFKQAPPAAPRASETTESAEVFGPPTPKSLELARKIVEAQDLLAKVRVQFEVSLLPVTDGKWPGVDDQTRDDVLNALRGGVDQYTKVVELAMARSYAVNFTEAELTDIATFMTSPAGRALTTRTPAVMEGVSSTTGDAEQQITRLARTIYCAQHPCVAAAPTDLPPSKAEASPKP